MVWWLQVSNCRLGGSRRKTLRHAAVVALVLTACGACAPLPRYEPRAARSSLGCMRNALEAQRPLPEQDSQAHCLAAGLIARHCSITEAWLASVAKEVADLFGPGNAEWRDLDADGRGIRCARSATDDASLRACCRSSDAP